MVADTYTVEHLYNIILNLSLCHHDEYALITGTIDVYVNISMTTGHVVVKRLMSLRDVLGDIFCRTHMRALYVYV